ncbi:alpha/beta hydrolase [soil metagenome]
MSTVKTSEHWIVHREGRIFAREWCPRGGSVDAAPIVMLHDSLGCVDLWREFPAALSASSSRRVIAYDRLGFGRSDPRTGRPSLDFVAEEASRYLPVLRAQLGIGRFVALGHSVGGGMAIEAAAQAPESCAGLITLAAQVFAEDRTLQGIRAAKQQFEDPAQVQRLSRYHGARTAWVLDAWIENWLDPRFGAWRLEPVLPRVSCPVLAIHGELDEYGSAIHPKAIGRLAGGPAQIEVLPGVGHVPHREQPDRVGHLIAEFLATRVSTRRFDR